MIIEKIRKGQERRSKVALLQDYKRKPKEFQKRSKKESRNVMEDQWENE